VAQPPERLFPPHEARLNHTPERSLVTPRTPSSRPEAHISCRGVLKHYGWGSTLPEGQVGITATVRQAKLRPECANRYPTLPARMWTSATHLAELVASYRRAAQRPEQTRKGRTLPEADFEFRGGFAQLIGRVDRGHPHSGEPTFSR
jgi:hypothetical protein